MDYLNYNSINFQSTITSAQCRFVNLLDVLPKRPHIALEIKQIAVAELEVADTELDEDQIAIKKHVTTHLVTEGRAIKYDDTNILNLMYCNIVLYDAVITKEGKIVNPITSLDANEHNPTEALRMKQAFAVMLQERSEANAQAFDTVLEKLESLERQRSQMLAINDILS